MLGEIRVSAEKTRPADSQEGDGRVLLEGWGLVLAVCGSAQGTQNTTAQTAEMHKVIYRDWIADKIFFVHFFQWHCDKQMILSDWKKLPSFWCNTMSVNDTLKSSWKGKAL